MDIEQIKIELGSRIKSYRIENNWTQEQFSSLIEIEQTNLSNIENGKTLPQTKTLCALIKKTNICPKYLFDFLNNTQCHTTIDFEILDLLSKLPNEAKKDIKKLLSHLNKQ